MSPIRPFLDKLPVLGERVYIDPACTIIGDVVLGDDVSVWPGTVIRGDVNHVRIGARSNIQDGTIIHVSHHSPFNKGGYPPSSARASRSATAPSSMPARSAITV